MKPDVDLTSKLSSTTEPPRSAEMSTYARSRDMRSPIDRLAGQCCGCGARDWAVVLVKLHRESGGAGAPLSLRLNRNTATRLISRCFRTVPQQLDPPQHTATSPPGSHGGERMRKRRRVWGEHLRRRSQARPGTPSRFNLIHVSGQQDDTRARSPRSRFGSGWFGFPSTRLQSRYLRALE